MKAFGKGTGYFKIRLLKPPHPKRSGRGEITASSDSHLFHASRNSSRSRAILHLECRLAGSSGCSSRATTPSSASPVLGGLCPPPGFQLVPIFSGCTVNIVLPPQMWGCPWGSAYCWEHKVVTGAEMGKGGWKSLFSRAVYSSPANSTCMSCLCFWCPVTVSWTLIFVYLHNLRRCDIWPL